MYVCMYVCIYIYLSINLSNYYLSSYLLIPSSPSMLHMKVRRVEEGTVQLNSLKATQFVEIETSRPPPANTRRSFYSIEQVKKK